MKERLRNLKENWQHLLILVMLNVVVVVFIELLWRKSILNVMSWMSGNFPMMLMNVALVLILSIVITMITRKYIVSYVIISNIALILGLINAKKIALRSVPLGFDDIKIFNEAMNLLPQFAELKSIVFVIVVLFLAASASFLIIKYSHKLIKVQALHLLIALVGSGLVFFSGQMIYGNDSDITSSGLLVSLMNSAKISTSGEHQFDDQELEGLEFVTQNEALEEVLIEQHDALLKSDIKPNVIIIQSEAFWDINKLDLTFNKNPIETFNTLQRESIHGEMYVPVIGGGTSNTEFEVLTGMTLKNYSNDWHMVYPNEIKAPTTSMASILRANGYYSVATHPYHGWYYNRSEVFKHMGFNEFKSIEFMDEPDTMGMYVSDVYITDEIIKNIENRDEPLFNMVVTMQNHAPFNDGRFAPKDLVVTYEEKFELSTQTILNNYVNSLYYTDLQLKRLTDYLRSSSEPTVVLLYGDHLPAMGDDYQVYRDTNFLEDGQIFVDDNLEMMSTPFILWSNYSDVALNLGMINASYVPAMMLEELDLDKPDYMVELASMYKKFPLFTRKIIVDVDGNIEKSDSENYTHNLKKFYALIQLKDDLKNPDNLKWIETENVTYNSMYDMRKVVDPNK